MSTYICKCGREVQKSTTADNPHNRKTEGCTGCPYLLPWGPIVYHEGEGYQMDVQGYECRMSPQLCYTTDYQGTASDKNSLRIRSLDFEWMERVDTWISEHYPGGELSGRFDRSEMRGTDFSSRGRYSWPIYCAQNRKGVEAKAALIAEFFTPDKYRKDLVHPGMTTVEQVEKEIVLNQIAAGKAAAQAKEALCVSQNPTASLTPTAAPSSDPSPATAPTASIGETAPGGRIGKLYLNGQRSLAYRCETNGFEMYHFAGKQVWTSSLYLESQYAVNNPQNLPPEQWFTWWAEGNPNWTEITREEFDEMCKEKKPAAAPTPDAAATMDAPAAKPAEATPTTPAVAGSSTAPVSRADAGAATQSLSDAAAACSEADLPAFDYSGLDKQTVADLHLAEREYAAGKRLTEMGLRRMADGVAIAHEALCVTDATICRNGETGKFSKAEQTFGAWCESIGISRKTAERLLQVSTLFDQSSPRQQKVLAELAPSLLYAAAKPSAPAELVQAVKDGDITTHKEYQRLLAEVKARDEKIEALLDATEAADRQANAARIEAKEARAREEEARASAHDYHLVAEEATAARDAARQQAADQAARIKELEARPVEVVGASSADIAKWRAEGEAAAKKELQRQLQKAQREAESQRRRAETAEADAEQATQEAQDYASQLGQIRQELGNGGDVLKVKQTVDACEQLLRPLIYDIVNMETEQYVDAMNCLAALGDKLTWATQNDAWPVEDWPGLCDEDADWEDEEDDDNG